VLQVNPQIYQDKSLLKHRKAGAAEHRECYCTDMRVETDLLVLSKVKTKQKPQRQKKKITTT
jgi:hypothetical protein